MVGEIESFIYEHFVRPMIDNTVPGYNPINTIVYGILLLVLAFYVIYPFLHKRGVKFDWTFMKTLLPYILFGSSLRVLEDQHILLRSPNPLDAGFYIFTPGIWILTFALVMVGLGLGWWYHQKTGKSMLSFAFYFGLFFAIPVLVLNLLNGQEWIGFAAILGLALVISGIVFWIGKNQKWTFLNGPLARLAFFGQMLDASATFIALQFFGCGEQHVLPRLLFGSFGNASFFFVKIPVTLLVLYYLHKEYAKEHDDNMYGFILIFLCILGLATGTRDFITVLVGTCSP
ncbi:MAG: DUF63 family protein [archaeon]